MTDSCTVVCVTAIRSLDNEQKRAIRNAFDQRDMAKRDAKCQNDV